MREKNHHQKLILTQVRKSLRIFLLYRNPIGFMNVRKSYRIKGQVIQMMYVYFLDRQSTADTRNNTEVFKMIQEMRISEEQIFDDEDPNDRSELNKLVGLLNANDGLIIRSVVDCVCSIDELLEMLSLLSSIGIELYSIEEPFLSNKNYFQIVQGMVALLKYFESQARQENYQKALEEGRVGRPSKTKQVEVALNLYHTNNYSVSEIEKITGISKTTIYKYLKEQKVG